MAKISWSKAPQIDDNPELSQFLDDLLTAIKPLQLIGNDVQIYAGTGSPEGVITAKVGSLYVATDGSTSTTLYVKTSGTDSSGWTAK